MWVPPAVLWAQLAALLGVFHLAWPLLVASGLSYICWQRCLQLTKEAGTGWHWGLTLDGEGITSWPELPGNGAGPSQPPGTASSQHCIPVPSMPSAVPGSIHPSGSLAKEDMEPCESFPLAAQLRGCISCDLQAGKDPGPNWATLRELMCARWDGRSSAEEPPEEGTKAGSAHATVPLLLGHGLCRSLGHSKARGK